MLREMEGITHEHWNWRGDMFLVVDLELVLVLRVLYTLGALDSM